MFHSLSPSLQEVIIKQLEWDSFREIQEETYEAYTSGKNLLIVAPTASGKSEAAFLPVIDSYLKKGTDGVFCLYISPQKALINDMESRLQEICSFLHIRIMKWHGDIPPHDRSFLDEPPVFLLTTPESLEVIFHRHDILPFLKTIHTIIIDEVHTLVPTERGVHLLCLLDRLDMHRGCAIQRIGLSATIGNPDVVASWLFSGSTDVQIIAVPHPPAKKKIVFTVCDEMEIPSRVAYLASGKQVLTFVDSRSRAERIASELRTSLPHVYIHHASLAADIRNQAENMLLSDVPVCLICTSTMELGIDIGPLEMVIQIGSPRMVSSCIQRLGRAGRRGTTPTMAFILKNVYELAQTVAVIECAENHQVEEIFPLKVPYTVLVQQILLYLIQAGRAPVCNIIQFVRRLSVFQLIPNEDIHDIISYLLIEGFLTKDGDLFMTGLRLEESRGKYMKGNLYSTISQGTVYTAFAGSGEEIGFVDPSLITAAGDTQLILLGGEPWKIVSIDYERMSVNLMPAEVSIPEGALSFWSGTVLFSSPLIVSGIERLIERRKSHLLQKGGLSDFLWEFCNGFPDEISQGTIVIRENERSVYLYTFLGCQWNQIIAACIQSLAGAGTSVTYGDLYLVTRGTLLHQSDNVTDILKTIITMEPEEIVRCIPLQKEGSYPFFEFIPPQFQSRILTEDRFAIRDMLSVIRKKKIRVIKSRDR